MNNKAKSRVICTVIILLLMQVMLPINALGANTWILDELGLSLEIPEEYVVFTRDLRDNDPNLNKYGMTKSEMDDVMRSRNIYLNAWDEDVSHEIVVTMIDSSIPDFSSLSDTALLALVSITVKPLEEAGAIVKTYEVYQQKQTKFLKLLLDQYDGGEVVHTVQYYTTVAEKAINITMHYYSGEVDDYHEQVLRDIVDSVSFNGPVETSVPYENTPAFRYSDSKTGAAFTVPKNWQQEELSKEREIINAKFISNEEPGLVIIYGSADLWEAMSESERMGSVRSDINNSAINKTDVSQMAGVKPSEVEMVSFNGTEYYKVVSNTNGEYYGYTLTIKMTSLYRFDNGYMYMFQTNVDESSSYYDDFKSLVSSMEFPRTTGTKGDSTGTEYSSSNQITGKGSNTSPEKDYSIRSLPWGIRLLIDLCITIILHPVPIWIYRYAIRKRPVVPQKAKRIVIVDAIIVFVIWFIIGVLINSSKISFLAIIVWSRICYASLANGYSVSNDYHIKIESCVLLSRDEYVDYFEYEGKKYDFKKYVALERDALLNQNMKSISDGYYRLQEENENRKLHGLGAANLEAYKQAILKHPDFQGTMLLRDIQRQSLNNNTTEKHNGELSEKGQEIELKVTIQKPKIRFCRRCGSELTPGNDNCPRCGTPVFREEDH